MKNSAQTEKKPRVTKHDQIKQHLLKHKHITSWEAIEKYGATRLSHHILMLRKGGWNIATNDITTKDRNGNTCVFAKYILASDPNKPKTKTKKK
jgi:hypothetical protein